MEGSPARTFPSDSICFYRDVQPSGFTGLTAHPIPRRATGYNNTKLVTTESSNPKRMPDVSLVEIIFLFSCVRTHALQWGHSMFCWCMLEIFWIGFCNLIVLRIGYGGAGLHQSQLFPGLSLLSPRQNISPTLKTCMTMQCCNLLSGTSTAPSLGSFSQDIANISYCTFAIPSAGAQLYRIDPCSQWACMKLQWNMFLILGW